MNIGLPYQRYTLTLPAGHVGVHFSTTIPCEIKKIEQDSPIYNESIEFLGRLAFHVCIPNKIEVIGALDKLTLESILAAYCNVPDRKILFKDKSERPDAEYFTTTVLPIGRIDASFRSTNGLFPSRNRVFVERSGYSNFAFPIGHYVDKIIVPNQFESKGGIRTPQRLFQILDHFANVPGRKIGFRKNIPRGSIVTRIILPQGHTYYDLEEGEDARKLPVVHWTGLGMLGSKLLYPSSYIIEKVIIPNEISMKRMHYMVVEKVLNHFSDTEGRVIVLKESQKDLSGAGGMVRMILPAGKLGMTFKSKGTTIWLSDVREESPVRKKCQIGFFVESLVIPGEMELVGGDELECATFLTKQMQEFSHLRDRTLVLKQYKQDVRKRTSGTIFNREFV